MKFVCDGNVRVCLGMIIPFEQRHVTVVRLLAEGGFSSVFEVRDVSTGASFALKRVITQVNKIFIPHLSAC